MIQTCPTCGAEFDYHCAQPECHPCQHRRTARHERIHRIIVYSFWTMAISSLAATIVIVIWRSLPKW